MTFRKYYFEELNETINGIVYFADKSSLKPKGMGTIWLKMPGFSDFLLNNVLYLPELQRSLLPLVQIRQQGHSIHMFDGIVEIRKSSDNQVIMTGYEDGKLLKLKGSSARVQNYAYLSQHGEGNLSSSSLWHARFGHLNYNSLRLLRKNGVFGLPTIHSQREEKM